jgi:fatty-acyl-CoA synthase
MTTGTPATIGELLSDTAARYADHPAIIYHGRGLTVSYGELLRTAGRVARSLAALGVVPGDHLAVWANNIPEWIYLQFGCALRGAVLVTVNTNYRSFELEYLLKQSESVALFMVNGIRRPGEYLAIVREICPEIGAAAPGNMKPAGLPHLRSIVLFDNAPETGMLGWDDFLALGDADVSDEPIAIGGDNVAMIQYTSGTTGFPKGVMLSHANLLGNVRDVAAVLGMTSDDRLCIPVPFFHCFGSVLGTLLCVVNGATMVPLEQFRPADVLGTVESLRCTLLHGVPAMFIAELEEYGKGNYDISSLRSGIMGGSPCPLEVMRAVTTTLGAREICIAYGLTETSPLITITRRDVPLELRSSTVGTPLPGVEVKIINPRTGEVVPSGVQGELCCRGYNVMQGYFKMPEATAQAIDRDGWFHSGDLATMDGAGYVRITGRAKDMIIRGGENIYPREIEEFLFTHPAVKDAQVIGVPSAFYGEEVAAFVQIREGARTDAGEIRDYCNGRVARHKVPRYVAVVDSYPTTASGKVQKYKLREQAITLFGLEQEAKSVVSRSEILRLEPGKDSCERIFSFIDTQVAPWGLDLEVLFKASAALNELLEMISLEALTQDPLDVRFSFDNFNLGIDVVWRGAAPEFPEQQPAPKDFVTDDGALARLSGYLVRSYAGQLTSSCRDDICHVQLYFEAYETSENLMHSAIVPESLQ